MSWQQYKGIISSVLHVLISPWLGFERQPATRTETVDPIRGGGLGDLISIRGGTGKMGMKIY